jgi:hypothetical protein
MKKQFHLLLITLFFGCFLLHSVSYACETKSQSSCCKKETSSKSEKKACCSYQQSKDKKDSCNGKCGHKNCTTSSLNFSTLSYNDIEIKNNQFNFNIQKSNYFYSKTVISSGFTSLWLLPKIG